jgi:hypothetical protein
LIDFSKKDEAAYEQFAKTCAGLDIGVLGKFVLCRVLYEYFLMSAFLFLISKQRWQISRNASLFLGYTPAGN